MQEVTGSTPVISINEKGFRSEPFFMSLLRLLPEDIEIFILYSLWQAVQ